MELLEQAKKRDHKVYITDEAIKKVGLVLLSDLSFSLAEKMQKLHKDLLLYSKEYNDSNEVLIISDIALSTELKVIGNEFVVSPAKNPFAVSIMLHADRQTLVFMHNHPSTNNFSVADIDTFICESAIKIMTVVTNQGEVFLLNKTSKYDYNKTRRLMAEIFDSFFEQSIDNKEFVRKFLKRCGEGGIEYAKSK